jgi:hypothetical protein
VRRNELARLEGVPGLVANPVIVAAVAQVRDEFVAPIEEGLRELNRSKQRE